MHIFFGDDSVRVGKCGGMGVVVGFGGVVIDAEKLSWLRDTVRSIRHAYDIPPAE
jgi:hypothetical protein